MGTGSLKYDEFLRILDARFARSQPARMVRATTRGLGWVSARLPRRASVRLVAQRLLAPGAAWVVRHLRPVFDFVAPSEEQYWERLAAAWRAQGLPGDAQVLDPFLRAVYAWLGVEGSAMHYGENWRISGLDERCCTERIYLRDEAGAERPGCPWGLRGSGDGFACRTIMVGSRDLFQLLGHAEMKIDISIPEMLAIERLVASHLGDHPDDDPDRIWHALEPGILAVFRASQPEEGDFMSEGRLRPETRAVVQDMIVTMRGGGCAAIFCQFRVVPPPTP